MLLSYVSYILELRCCCHMLNTIASHIFHPYADSLINASLTTELKAADDLQAACHTIVVAARSNNKNVILF